MQYTTSVFVKSQLFTSHTDARTEQVAADLYDPTDIDDSVFSWIDVPDGASLVRARAAYLISTTGVAQAPEIQVVGMCGNRSDIIGRPIGGFPKNGSVWAKRLDASTWAAPRQLLTTNGSPSTTNTHNDGTYFYSDWTSYYDIDGSVVVGTPVDPTNAVGVTPSAAVLIQIEFI